MITWVLAEEPTADVARAIEIVEARLGSSVDDVLWVSPTEHVAEPAQD